MKAPRAGPRGRGARPGSVVPPPVARARRGRGRLAGRGRGPVLRSVSILCRSSGRSPGPWGLQRSLRVPRTGRAHRVLPPAAEVPLCPHHQPWGCRCPPSRPIIFLFSSWGCECPIVSLKPEASRPAPWLWLFHCVCPHQPCARRGPLMSLPPALGCASPHRVPIVSL